MTDIKDKLQRLKQERKLRSKNQKIQDNWSEIEKEDGLSTKEKLQQLINLSREEKPKEQKRQAFEPQKTEPLQILENAYTLDTRYGRFDLASGLKISSELLTCLSADPGFKTLDLSSSLFIDLETTGLSGGSGTVPFLIGLGYYREDQFWVVQYFLGELAEEERMIEELSQFLADMKFESIVTYNGKAFDMPILETRFVMNRKSFPLNDLPHLDFLFPARRLWSHKYENCRLFNLALEVIRTDRADDIPSAEIPWRYFQYLQTGNFDLVEPIIYHNAEDILSLLGVITAGAAIFSEDKDLCSGDAMDFFGAGKIMEGAGDEEKSMQFYEQALDGNLSDDVSLSVRRRLSLRYKKNEEWEKALSLWKEMTDTNDVSRDLLFSFRELAMYFEHREKKFDVAKKYTEEGYVSSMGYSALFELDFSHRLDRLNKKIRIEKEAVAEKLQDADEAKGVGNSKKHITLKTTKTPAKHDKRAKTTSTSKSKQTKQPTATKSSRTKSKKEKRKDE